MIIRPDGIKIYEDGDKDVDLYQVVYNLNKDIRILCKIIDRVIDSMGPDWFCADGERRTSDA